MKATDTRFVIRKSRPGMGAGLFARADIAQGEFLLEYTGKRIPTKVADELTTKYLFELDEEWTIDGEDESNTARYINHACLPNAEVEIEDDHLNIYALRDIHEGEEITMDYGKEYYDEFIKPEGCKCGSARHRR